MEAAETASPRVLFVEDEVAIREGLVALFSGQGFEVDEVGDGPAALEALGNNRYDLVVLDLMIPDIPGLDVLRRVRARGDETPFLILTARGAEDDVVAGIEAGADDYVTKPFGIRELLARARGLLRRPRRDDVTARRVTIEGAELDLDAQTLVSPRGSLRLTAREVGLLDHLLRYAHRPVTREELLVEVWGYRDGSIRTRTVDVHVQQLRSKLRRLELDGWIETVRGRGYRLGKSPA